MKKLLFKIKKFSRRLKRVWDMPDAHKEHEIRAEEIYSYIEALDKKIGERTEVHADIHFKTNSTVIVIEGAG